jgi:integrase
MKESKNWSVLVNQYIEHRRSLGFTLEIEAGRLQQFARFAQKVGPQDGLTIALAAQWARASHKQTAITWAGRIETLRGFAKYLQRFDAATEIPPRDLFGPSHRRLIPHIYTDEELCILLNAAEGLLPIGGLRPATCRMVFGLLATTGLRISEALNLTREAVDLESGLLNIQEAKFHKQRFVPLHPTVTGALKSYAALRDRLLPTSRSEQFFLFDDGQLANRRKILHALHTLCQQLGWAPRGDHQHHRLHDFRHSFIVRSALYAYRQDIDVDKHILALSTYVGHAKVADTYWYFTGIPELMTIAAGRFLHYSNGGEL